MPKKQTYEVEVLADVLAENSVGQVETKVLFSGKDLFTSGAGATRWAEIEAHKEFPEVDLDDYEVTVRPFRRS